MPNSDPMPTTDAARTAWFSVLDCGALQAPPTPVVAAGTARAVLP